MPAPSASPQPEFTGRARVLLDTFFCLHLIRTRPRHLLPAFSRFGPGEVAISALSVAVLQARAESSRNPGQNRFALERFLLPLHVVDFDADAARLLGQVIAWWGEPAAATSAWPKCWPRRRSVWTPRSSPPTRRSTPPSPTCASTGRRPPPCSSSRPRSPTTRPRTRSPASGPRSTSAPGAIVAVGSHDMTLDLLGDMLHAQHPSLTLVSAHVGSLGGLMALQRNEAHLAGSHLLDEETGDYNVGAIRRVLTPYGRHVILLGFVERRQGLIVAPGNPHAIANLEDLLRPGIRFVNRQAGAGTRLLLDLELRKRGLDAAQIAGYARQESSHAAVAAAVAGDDADCGLGIQAAAHAQHLDFIPLFSERYDLVIPREHYEGELLAPLLELLRKPAPAFLRRRGRAGRL